MCRLRGRGLCLRILWGSEQNRISIFKLRLEKKGAYLESDSSEFTDVFNGYELDRYLGSYIRL